jgi:hypothetical protein
MATYNLCRYIYLRNLPPPKCVRLALSQKLLPVCLCKANQNNSCVSGYSTDSSCFFPYYSRSVSCLPRASALKYAPKTRTYISSVRLSCLPVMFYILKCNTSFKIARWAYTARFCRVCLQPSSVRFFTQTRTANNASVHPPLKSNCFCSRTQSK